MHTDFLLQLVGITPFLTIDGVPFAIWTYSLSWSETSTWRSLVGLDALDLPGTRVGLELSRRITVRDPAGYPNVPEIQATKLDKPTTGDVQVVYGEFAGPPVSPVVLSFIAPAAPDTFCPVKLVHKPAIELPWTSLPLKVSPGGDTASQQLIIGPAVVCPSTTPPSKGSIVLDHASRFILKATHVPLATPDLLDGGARLKFGFVRQLSLQAGEVDAVASHLGLSGAAADDLANVLRPFERSESPVPLPPVSAFVSVAPATLQQFGAALVEVRQRARGGAPQQRLLRAAVAANKGFVVNSTLTPTPIGMLNLERLEMAPAGIERGELIATIPLAPGEKTAVVQKEWSVTTKEFTSIVTDSLENFSETGVTDNTELAQSTTSQIQHANQFNITGTVSGGIPLISGSVTSSFGAQDSSSQSATDSRTHAVQVTQKASSRTKQEHKVTISTTTVTGTSETTTRELVNPSKTDPMRIDYFSMMRKWRVRLYRYGLRLTYDIVIPEPAGTLRKAYAQLDSLRRSAGPFAFSIKHSDINEGNYQSLADQFQASVPSPKPATITMAPVGGVLQGLPSNDGDSGWRMFQFPFTIPDDYELNDVTLEVMLSNVGNQRNFYVLGSGQAENLLGNEINKTYDLTAYNGFMKGVRGNQSFTCFEQFAAVGSAVFTITGAWTAEARAQWQADVWNALYNAAQTQYYARQQDIAAQIAQLEAALDNVDTLTLRREENDEIMKGAMRFLLGVGFDFMDDTVDFAITTSGPDVDAAHGVAFTTNKVAINGLQLAAIAAYEDDVRFINQAIEWENVVSFLYSYFWDLSEGWDFIRQISAPDSTRQAFLRAGSARVVLTVRKGFEQDWLRFVDGVPPGVTTPRLTIAQEIAAYDDRNYPGIPPANPGQGAVRLEDAVFASSTMELPPPSGSLPLFDFEIDVDSTVGFLVGATVTIGSGVHTDSSNTFGWQEVTTITAIRDTRHITVAQVQYEHGGDDIPYPIVQPGEKGVLIAEWNEYTPTSGTDIGVTSSLATIS